MSNFSEHFGNGLVTVVDWIDEHIDRINHHLPEPSYQLEQERIDAVQALSTVVEYILDRHLTEMQFTIDNTREYQMSPTIALGSGVHLHPDESRADFLRIRATPRGRNPDTVPMVYIEESDCYKTKIRKYSRSGKENSMMMHTANIRELAGTLITYAEPDSRLYDRSTY